MKYGLRSEDSRKNKWKILMEEDVANLKIEVSVLKQQLKNSLDIINILLSKASDEPSTKDLKDIPEGTMLLKYIPAWIFDSSTQQCGRLHCISPFSKKKSFEELRLEDYELNSGFLNQNLSMKGCFTNMQHPIDKMPVVEDTYADIQEDKSLSKIASHLEKINKNMTFLTSKLSKMDINLSEINSQMSVMDSRLSAVDMFVTMQQVDRRWQELTSTLQTIENNAENSEPSNNSNAKESLLRQDSILLNTSMQKPCNLPQDNSTKDTALMSDLSNVENNIRVKSYEIGQNEFHSNADVSFEKAKLEEDKVSNNCSSQTAVVDRPENSKLQNLPKNYVCNSGGDIGQQNSNAPEPSKGGSEMERHFSKLVSEYEKILSKCSKENILGKKIKNHQCGGNLGVEENDFVFVSKSDIDALRDQRAEEAKINMYSNITEYLEENLKKKKDSVYEFSFNKYLRDRQIQESIEETI